MTAYKAIQGKDVSRSRDPQSWKSPQISGPTPLSINKVIEATGVEGWPQITLIISDNTKTLES